MSIEQLEELVQKNVLFKINCETDPYLVDDNFVYSLRIDEGEFAYHPSKSIVNYLKEQIQSLKKRWVDSYLFSEYKNHVEINLKYKYLTNDERVKYLNDEKQTIWEEIEEHHGLKYISFFDYYSDFDFLDDCLESNLHSVIEQIFFPKVEDSIFGEYEVGWDWSIRPPDDVRDYRNYGELVLKLKFIVEMLTILLDDKQYHSQIEKLKWLGTPSQFGYIMQELIGKGYLEQPGTSLKRTAEFFLQIFDIDTTLGTLEKELSMAENQNSLSSANRTKIKISPKDQLK